MFGADDETSRAVSPSNLSGPVAAAAPPFPAAEAAASPPSGRYGGFWIRVAAYFYDAFLVAIVTMLGKILMTVSAGVPVQMNWRPTVGGNSFSSCAEAFVSLVIGWLYFAGLESSARQATLGKRAVYLRVTDLSGRRISFGRATGRYFGKVLSALIIFVGFLMVAFTERKQGLHDKIARTLVVRD